MATLTVSPRGEASILMNSSRKLLNRQHLYNAAKFDSESILTQGSVLYRSVTIRRLSVAKPKLARQLGLDVRYELLRVFRQLYDLHLGCKFVDRREETGYRPAQLETGTRNGSLRRAPMIDFDGRCWMLPRRGIFPQGRDQNELNHPRPSLKFDLHSRK